jgi:hypothetical protein
MGAKAAGSMWMPTRRNSLTRNVQQLKLLDIPSLRQQVEEQGWSLGPVL